MRDAIEKDDSVIVGCILKEGLLDADTMYNPVVAFISRFRTSFLHLAALHNAVESAKVSSAVPFGVWHYDMHETMR